MREILFRGKRIDIKEWLEGYCVKIGPLGKEKTYIIPSYASTWYGATVDPATVGQYTGQTDSNNVKIFEGDIVRTKYRRMCIVEWFAPRLCWDLKPIDTKENLSKPAPTSWDLWESENLKVLSNIHDNPELLEGGAK